MENRMMDWGLSMYGGYYSNLVIDGHVVGVHAETKKELKKAIEGKLGKEVKLDASRRMDN